LPAAAVFLISGTGKTVAGRRYVHCSIKLAKARIGIGFL